MEKNRFQPEQRSFIGIFKILIVVTMGIGLYLLLNHTPLLITMFPVNMPNPSKTVVEEIEYRDKDGGRINSVTYARLIGYETAKERGIITHADCKASFRGFEQTGCDRYVSEQKHFPARIKREDF